MKKLIEDIPDSTWVTIPCYHSQELENYKCVSEAFLSLHDVLTMQLKGQKMAHVQPHLPKDDFGWRHLL
jgi:hypothetical protein